MGTVNWSADFITSPNPSGAADDPAIYLRHEFQVGRNLRCATLYYTAIGLIEPRLNGSRVGDEVLAPGWTSYRHRVVVSSLDVSDLIHEGPNALGAIIGQGWAVGRLGWDSEAHHWSDQPAGWLQLQLDYDDRTQVIESGPDFLVGTGGVRANSLYDGEVFDARLEMPGWDAPGFDDSQWVPAAILDWDKSVLVTADAPPIQRIQELVPVSLTQVDGRHVVDFGQIVTGWVKLRVANGAPGTEVTLRHAELLSPDGTADFRTLRTARATDRYVVGEPEPSWFEPRFTFHGFRYAEIDGYPGELSADDIRAVVVHSPMERTGWFTSSNELINKLHDNAIWSMRGNFVGVPTDCPQRDERLGWTGDINAFAPTAVLLQDAQAFLRNWLVDLRLEQAATGNVPWVVPDMTKTPSSPTGLWSDVVVSLPWVLYQEYGDPAILEEAYDSMAAFVRQVRDLLNEDGLWDRGFQFGDWLDPDAPADNPAGGKTDRHLVASAYFARVTRQMADTAAILGRAERDEFEALADRVRAAFRSEYVTRNGRITNESATAYALAICFDLLETNQEEAAGARLAKLVADAGYTVSTGFAGTPWVLPALSRTGQWKAAYQMFTQTRCPSILYPVTMGATTIWERWDAITPDGELNDHGMTSLNHYALGAVVAWLYEAVGGLSALEPGWRRIRVAPTPGGGLTHADTAHVTPLGKVSVSWRMEGAQMTLDVQVPEGAEAEVVLPLDPDARTVEVGPGAHSWTYELPEASIARPAHSMNTPLSELAADPVMWPALQRVFAKHLPGIPIDEDDPQAASISLDVMFQFIPHPPPGFREDLEATLHDPAYADDLEAPAALDEALAASVELLSGASFWTTVEGQGIPSLTLSDGPHGVRLQKQGGDHLGIAESHPATCFPPAVATASSFDADLVEQIGSALGAESRALGVDVLLGPGINIKRSPLGGRNFEYFSEDPLLSGELGAAWVRGVQSHGVGTSLKHFAVNSQETERMSISAEVDERTLRELYLPAFEKVITDASPTTVMSAYNAINGVFASENKWLLTELLRDEWGFEGLVVSDWGAIKDRVEALRAGLDLEMPGSDGAGSEAILAGLRDGRVSSALVEKSVARLRRLAELVSVGATQEISTRRFAPTRSPEGGEVSPDRSPEAEKVDFDAHHALARRAAAASIVLLRNEGILPLEAGRSVAVIGALALDPQFQGGGSSRVNPTRVDVPLEELKLAMGADNVSFAPGYSMRPASADPSSSELIDEAVNTARDADAAVVFVGLDEADQSEGFDRENLDLPSDQVQLIMAVSAVAPTVVVLSNGGVVTLEPWHDKAAAIVEAWASGQAMGGAVADILSGRTNPSGRLAETIPFALEDNPSYLNFPGENGVVRYGEGVFVGYRYYTSTGTEVRYPFGHGLSYTTFEQNLELVEPIGPDTVRVRVRVTNTGEREGAEVVQLYVSPQASPVRRPRRELAAFRKVFLLAGETTEVEFKLERRRFAFWDVTQQNWAVHADSYQVELGRSASEILESATVELDGDQPALKPLTLEASVKDWFGHPVVGPLLQEAMLAGATEEQKAAMEANAHMIRMIETMPMSQFARFPGVEINDDVLNDLIARAAE